MQSRPFRYALAVAGAYLVLAGAWIFLSGHLAADSSHSVEELAQFELIKGILFVAFTGAATFGAALLFLRRLEQHHAELAHARDALIVSERRALAGLLAASIAHDCNNLLVGAYADLDELAPANPGSPAAEAHQRLDGALQRMTDLFRSLMSLGKERAEAERQQLDLAEAVRSSLSLLRSQPRLKHCALTLQADEPLLARAHPALVDQMVMNLVLNAADATSGRGRVEVRLRAEGDHALLEVHDDGPGIPADQRSRLFQAFATTKEHGCGLGLLSARGCAEAQGGSVEIDDSPLGGACFRVVLPAEQPNAAARAA